MSERRVKKIQFLFKKDQSVGGDVRLLLDYSFLAVVALRPRMF